MDVRLLSGIDYLLIVMHMYNTQHNNSTIYVAMALRIFMPSNIMYYISLGAFSINIYNIQHLALVKIKARDHPRDNKPYQV